MKKPTIAELQKEIEVQRAEALSARTDCKQWQSRYYDASKARDVALDKNNEVETETQRHCRDLGDRLNDKQRELDNLRNDVLMYFIAVSNPVTAKDAKAVANLQARICQKPGTMEATRPAFPFMTHDSTP